MSLTSGLYATPRSKILEPLFGLFGLSRLFGPSRLFRLSGLSRLLYFAQS